MRIMYSKTNEGRFLSHLDLLRAVERAFRRAGLPLAYSEGYNPHPRISYGSALAVGVTSEAEYLDVELRQRVSAAEAAKRIEAALPPALKLVAVKELERQQPSLMAMINLARYQVTAQLSRPVSQDEANDIVQELLQQDSILITRKGKKGERIAGIRSGIYQMTAQAGGREVKFLLELQTGSTGNVRPEEVLVWLEKNILQARGVRIEGSLLIHRQGLFIKEGDRIRTPL